MTGGVGGRPTVRRTPGSGVRRLGLTALVLACAPTLAMAQVRASAGVLLDPDPSVGRARVGPLVSVALSADGWGVPLFVEASFARTDFSSLGRDYHHNYTLLTLGGQWFPVQGATRVGLRLAAGAVREHEIVETDPWSDGGDNWAETVTPGFLLERRLGGGRSLVLVVSDHLMGAFQALIDPEESGLEHRITVSAGVRF